MIVFKVISQRRDKCRMGLIFKENSSSQPRKKKGERKELLSVWGQAKWLWIPNALNKILGPINLFKNEHLEISLITQCHYFVNSSDPLYNLLVVLTVCFLSSEAHHFHESPSPEEYRCVKARIHLNNACSRHFTGCSGQPGSHCIVSSWEKLQSYGVKRDSN